MADSFQPAPTFKVFWPGLAVYAIKNVHMIAVVLEIS